MSDNTKISPFYAVIFLSAPNDNDDKNIGKTGSMLVALAATVTGYLGFEKQCTAGNRTVAVCFFDSNQALYEWSTKAEELTSGEQSQDNLPYNTFTPTDGQAL